MASKPRDGTWLKLAAAFGPDDGAEVLRAAGRTDLADQLGYWFTVEASNTAASDRELGRSINDRLDRMAEQLREIRAELRQATEGGESEDSTGNRKKYA